MNEKADNKKNYISVFDNNIEIRVIISKNKETDVNKKNKILCWNDIKKRILNKWEKLFCFPNVYISLYLVNNISEYNYIIDYNIFNKK